MHCCDELRMVFSLATALLILLAVTNAQPPADADVEQRARAIHDRVITLDSHVDIEPGNFSPRKNYTQDLPTQVNLPKMMKGGLDAAFFIVYTEQGPLTEEGSGLLIMAIAGGALVVVQGWLADLYDLQMSFLLTAACELYILFYALWGSKPVVSGEGPAAVEPPGMVPSDAS